MRTLLLAFGCLALLAALWIPATTGEKKNFVATDPEKAGPDWQVQGEYVGMIGQEKYGAEVIARGDGKFDVNFLPGGLRGEGGDYQKRIAATAKSDGAKTVILSRDPKFGATILGSKMTGKNMDLHKVTRKSKTLGMKPPEGAIVLYGDPKDVSEWNNGKVVEGNLLGSEIDSKKSFKDHKIHLEFRLSFMPFASGQGRSNSGVYPQHRYEVQVLDSFGLKGANNECGGIYSQAAPKVNMCYPPLTWQTYDIELKSARFDEKGKKIANAVISVWHNGVLIHDKYEIKKGPTGGGRPETAMGGPLHLQGHGGQVQYRNIWVVPMGEGTGEKK